MTPFDFFAWHLKGLVVLAAGYCVMLALRYFGVQSSNVRQLGILAIFVAALWPWSVLVEIPCLPATGAMTDETSDQLSASSSSGETSPTVRELIPFTVDNGGREVAAAANAPAPATARPWNFPAAKILHWLSVLFLVVWLLGCVAMIAVAIIYYWTFVASARFLRRFDPQWEAEWRDLLRERNHSTWLPLRVTRRLGPALALLPYGFQVTVPRRFWKSLTPRQRRTILRHELAHYERGDIWRTSLIRLLALPFWAFPVACRLVLMFDEAAEDACDREAVGNHDSLPYAQALERLVAAPYPAISLALGQSAQSHPLVQRVRRVLNPHPQDTPMKTILSAVAVCALALVSLLQIRLVAEDKPAKKGPATVESVKAEAEALKTKLVELKESVELVKQDLGKLKERIEGKVQSLKELASDPNNISAEAKGLVEDLKSGDEARQLKALEASDKLKSDDEKLIICGYLAKDGASEAVRQKAIATAAAKGEAGLPVFAHAFENLSVDDRVYAVEQLAKNKDTHPAVFARISQDSDEQVKVAALTAGLKTKDPLIFLALAVEINEGNADIVVPRLSILQGENLRLALFAAALKGPEKILPDLVQPAALLDEAGYPILLAIFERRTPESRAALVKMFAKTTNELEGLLVTKARQDPDPKLREAAEKATDGFGASGIGAEK